MPLLKSPYTAIMLLFLIILNTLLSSYAIKECMFDYLKSCREYEECSGKVYDLAYYNQGETIWHVVHSKDDTFAKDPNIPHEERNNVEWCWFKTDNLANNISQSIQCADVWIYINITELFNEVL